MSAAADLAPPVGAIYARISLDATGQEAGVERQRAVCEELADRLGYHVEHVLVDNDISASSGKHRPGYAELLDLMRRGRVDAVFAYHSDRLYRRLADLAEFLDVVKTSGVEVHTVAAGSIDLSTASGRFTAAVIGAASQHEAERLGERVKMKHRENAKAGKAHGGGRPFGYTRGGPGELVVKPDEAELIREAAAAVLRGSSLNSIVIDWNERGVPTVNGGKWRPNSLSKMLRAGRNAALREVGGDVLGEGDWEPILDRGTWERVRSRITHAPAGRRPRRHLLAGMVFCAECGARMRSVSGGNGKYTYPGFQCDKAIAHGCGSNSAKMAAIEEIVLAYLFDALPRVNIAGAMARRSVEASTALVADIAADEQLLNDMAADLGARRIGRAEWLAASDPIRARLEENRRRLDAIADDTDEPIDVNHLNPEGFETLTFEQKRAVLRLFVARVEVRKGRPGRNFDPTRVRVVPA